MIVCPTPPQMNDFCDLLGTPDAPVSKTASVKTQRAVVLNNLKHFDTSISTFLNKITLLAPSYIGTDVSAF